MLRKHIQTQKPGKSLEAVLICMEFILMEGPSKDFKPFEGLLIKMGTYLLDKPPFLFWEHVN
jgi:hypothetical protein